MRMLLWALGKCLIFVALFFVGELPFIPLHFLIFYLFTDLFGFPQELLLTEWHLKFNKSAPWTAAGAALLAAWIMTRFIDKRPFGSLGLKFHPHWWREFLLGLLIGSSLVMLLMVFLLASGTLVRTPVGTLELLKGKVLVALTLALPFNLGVAIYQEILARGYGFQTLIGGVGIVPALLITSFWFALGHPPYPGAAISAGLGGLLMGIAYLRSRSLWVPIGIHFAFNYGHYLLRLSYEANWASNGILALGVGMFAFLVSKFLNPHPQMEALWQQYVPIAQPWAHLKAWWAKRRSQKP